MPCRWSRPARFLLLLSLAVGAQASCLKPADAPHKIGATTCVAGTVTRITQGPGGVQYIDFCSDHAQCDFSGVVFADDLRDVGDIRTLPGKLVEVHGELHQYEGHAEIIVRNARQLRGAHLSLPPVPKEYDVEQRGHFSAGTFRAPKKAKSPKRKRRRQLPGTMEIPSDQPE